MAQINLELVLKGITGATDAVKQFSKTATSSLAKIETGFNAISSLGAGLAAGLTFKKIIEETVEAEAAQKGLANALRLSGEATGINIARFSDFSEELSKTTKFTDEQVLAQISYLKALGATNDQAEKMVSTAADLAVITGTSLDTAVAQLNATLSGTAGALGKQIKELKGFSKEQLQAGAAVDFLSEKLKGSAAQDVKGLGGDLNQASKAIQDFAKAIGSSVAALNSGLGIISGFTEGVRFFTDAIKGFGIFGGTAVAVLTSFAAAVDLVVVGLGKLLAVTAGLFSSSLSAKITSITDSLRTLPGIMNATAAAARDASRPISNVPLVLANADQLLKAANDKAKGLTGTVDNANEALKKLGSSIEQLRDKLKNAGLTPLQAIEAERIKQLQLVNEAFNKNVIKSVQEREDLISKIEIDAEKKRKEERKKINEQFAKDPVRAAIENGGINNLEQGAAAGAGVLGSALQGSAGASSLVSGALGSVADSVVPGLGGVVSQIASVLAQGPEAAKAFINGFVDSLPTVIQAIVDSIPVVIQTLVDRAPDIITALTLAIPKAANTLAIELGLRAPDIARDFAVAFVKEGIPQIVKGFLDEIKKGFDTLNPFGGGGIGGGLGDLQKTISTGGLNKIFGFASGGIVPGNGNVDKVPALLTPGEAMIDTSVSGRLLNFLDSFEREQSQSNRGGTQNLTVNFVMDKQVLASQLIEIDRDGIRTTA